MNDDNAGASRRPSQGWLWAALLACSLLLAAPFAHAQQPAEVDPPGRAARLSEVIGQVWLYSPETNEWLSAQRNQPLTSADRIATDEGGRAEISLGTTTLRLDAGSELEIVRLDDLRYVVRLQGGSLAARLQTAQAASEFELDTDEGRFIVQAAGRYRFDRYEQASDVTVYSGRASFEGRNSALPVGPGQHAQFWLDAGGAPQYSMAAPLRDAFAAWNDDRDRADDRAPPLRYVSAEMTGAEDLDRYGRWEETPEYGALWYPAAVGADWAPYRTGRWAWVRPWGWTWVDEAPWGFAPFHYGRWVRYRESWAWAPGTRVARPVYAPALVAWMGGGGRGTVSLSIGSGGPPVGWFPLAPREVYVPSYRASPRYVQNINITHVTNVTVINNIVSNRNGEADRRDFRNRGYAGAVTIVPSAAFAGRQPVGPIAARFHNDPQARNLLADGRPGPAQAFAPVAPPPMAPRPADGRAPRPPFEGRAPGGFGGRDRGFGGNEPGRGEPGRGDFGRGEPGRGEPGRGEPGRGEPGRGGPRGAEATQPAAIGAPAPQLQGQPGRPSQQPSPGAPRAPEAQPGVNGQGAGPFPQRPQRPTQPTEAQPAQPGRPAQPPAQGQPGAPVQSQTAAPQAQSVQAPPQFQRPQTPVQPAQPGTFSREPRTPRSGEAPADVPRFQGPGRSPEEGRDAQGARESQDRRRILPVRPTQEAPMPAATPGPAQAPAPARVAPPAQPAVQPPPVQPRPERPPAPRVEPPRVEAPKVEAQKVEAPRPQAATPKPETARPEGRPPRDDKREENKRDDKPRENERVR